MNKLLCALLIGLCLMGTAQAQARFQAQAKLLSDMDPAAKHLRLSRDRFERYLREQQLARPSAAQPLITLPAAADSLGAQDTPAAQPATDSRVGGIRVTGDEHLNPGFVLERLHQTPGEVLSIEQLEHDLIRFNALHEPQLSATVSAGAGAVPSDVALHVQPAKRHSVTTFADNAGNDAVGEARGGLIYRGSGLLGCDDTLQLITAFTKGSQTYGVTYSVPVNRDDLRLDVLVARGHIDVLNGPFVPLGITGRSREVAVGLTQPFAVSLDEQWAGYVRLSSRNSVNLLKGRAVPERELKVFSLGVSAESNRDAVAWTLDNSVNVGAKVLGGDEQFAYYRAHVARIDRLSQRVQLVTRAGVQYSFDRVLPMGEQFQAGGISTVRGFTEGLLSGRSGYALSAELRAVAYAPPPGAPAGPRPVVQVLSFFDHGAALPYRPCQSTTHDDDLTSVGVGVVLDFSRRVTTRVTAAWPLDQNPAEQRQRSPRVLAAMNIAWI
jgi:hemolysin activation/secretion protein